MAKYRKKPIVVEARGPITGYEDVKTVGGVVVASPGYYIVTDPNSGDTWPVEPNIFEATYEKV